MFKIMNMSTAFLINFKIIYTKLFVWDDANANLSVKHGTNNDLYIDVISFHIKIRLMSHLYIL